MNNSMILSLIAVAWLTGLAGCEPTDNVIGSKANTASGMGGSNHEGVGGIAQGGFAQGGFAQGGFAGTSSSGPGGTAGSKASCEDYLDATDGRAIDVIVKNDRSAPVYVGNRLSKCWKDDTLSVYDASGNQLDLDEYPSMSCTCQDYMQKGSYACSVGICLRSPLVRLAPGETMALKWDGYYLGASRAFRTECAVQGEPRDTCYSTLAAPSGKYKLAVLGSTSYGCAWESDQFDCNCVETNSCGFGMVPLEGRGEMLQPSIDFDLMNTQSVTVRFTDSMGGSGGAPPTADG